MQPKIIDGQIYNYNVTQGSEIIFDVWFENPVEARSDFKIYVDIRHVKIFSSYHINENNTMNYIFTIKPTLDTFSRNYSFDVSIINTTDNFLIQKSHFYIYVNLLI